MGPQAPEVDARRIRPSRVVAVVTATMALAILAGATAEGRKAQDPQRQGIENARAAGITVDPRAEELMARAPRGTCGNDPTLSKCPKASAVVRDDEMFDDGAKYANGEPSAGLARASAAYFQCQVSAYNPYKEAGVARGYADNFCSPAVSRMEMAVILMKFYSTKWYNMDTDYVVRSGGGGQRGYTAYACTATPSRTWQLHADGYALLNGVWYAGSDAGYTNLNCG